MKPINKLLAAAGAHRELAKTLIHTAGEYVVSAAALTEHKLTNRDATPETLAMWVTENHPHLNDIAGIDCIAELEGAGLVPLIKKGRPVFHFDGVGFIRPKRAIEFMALYLTFEQAKDDAERISEESGCVCLPCLINA